MFQGRAFSRNDLHKMELVNDNPKVGRSWEETLVALKKEPQADLLTVGEADSRAECFGVGSFRSILPRRAGELIEVGTCGVRCFGRPAPPFFKSSK